MHLQNMNIKYAVDHLYLWQEQVYKTINHSGGHDTGMGLQMDVLMATSSFNNKPNNHLHFLQLLSLSSLCDLKITEIRKSDSLYCVIVQILSYVTVFSVIIHKYLTKCL